METSLTAPDTGLPLPMEYRYRTGLAACLFGGAGVLAALLLLGGGAWAFVLVLPAVALALVGLAGLMADPRGLLHSMGHRLIVTDDLIEEVDEKAQVLWQLRCGEVTSVRTASSRFVLPGIDNTWRAEVLELVTGDGRGFLIPVWLLPSRGTGFKQRLDAFVQRGRCAGEEPSAS